MNQILDPNLPLYSDIVLKLNNTSTKFNKRILCVKDDFLFYYNTVPSKFQTNKFELLKGTPKAGVSFADILKIYGHLFKKISCFSIEFPKEKLIKFNSLIKKASIMKLGITNMSFNMISSESNIELTDKKSDGKIIRWIFSTKGVEDQDKKISFWVIFSFFCLKIKKYLSLHFFITRK